MIVLLGLFVSLSIEVMIPVQARAASALNGKYDVGKYYITREYQIRMRDGAKLFTTVYQPKDGANKQYPFLLQRTNYMGFFPHSPPEDLAKSGYIFVFQDARGTYRSDGTFLELSPRRDRKPANDEVDESTDTFDTVEWLLSNITNNNGKVGIWGGSYEGFYTSASIANTHPAIKAADIEIMGDWNYHNGAFMLGDNFEFYIDYRPKNDLQSARFQYWTRDPYEFFRNATPLSKLNELYIKNPNPLWTDIITHDTLDSFWKERDLLAHLNGIHCAVLNVGGWFDQYVPGGPIAYYHTIKENNPEVSNRLVMGPWKHGDSLSQMGRRLGLIDFQSDTGAYYRNKIRNPFFEHYLKGKSAQLPIVAAFETGTNVWREYSQWPPAGVQPRTLYLRESGVLSFDRPTSGEAFDEYVSDPMKPVPLQDSVPVDSRQLMSPTYMTADQRFAGRRPDVLVYQTEVLRENVTIVGPLLPTLFVSTTGTDSDWIVKLIDVYPSDIPDATAPNLEKSKGVTGPALTGYQQLIRGEPLRGKFRHGWDHPEPFVPGQVEQIQYTMADVNHTFLRGHRIMLQVQSTWFPLADLNPQKFESIPNAKLEDFQKATQRVYRSSEFPSALILQTLTRSAASQK